MLKLLIGPVLVGAGYAAGSYYGSDVEQVVHKRPSTTFDALDQSLRYIKSSGKTSFDGGAPTPYEVKVDRTPDERLVITISFGGKPGVEANVDFSPVNDGQDTLLKAHIHAERDVLRSVLAGTDKARLAYAPDWLLNLSFKPLLEQLAGEIDRGEVASFEQVSEGEAEARWEANLSERQRGQLSHWRQYEATRPLVDPDAAAQNYTDPVTN